MAGPGRPPVPGNLHADFISKLGGDQETADAELRAWYPTVAARYAGQPIGEDDFTFWRARFREWVGTSAAAEWAARRFGPSYEQTDWWQACRHDPRCETRPMHAQREAIDAAKRERG